MNDGQMSDVVFDHAVVIGSSIAGLTAARVLTDHFARVTIIERDRRLDTPEFRRGVPQARHAHILPSRGQTLLEGQFPGLIDELLAKGATSIADSSQLAFFLSGEWRELRNYSAVASTTFSRPLLESTIYRRVAAHPRVHILQGYSVVGLSVDERRERVTGVRLRSRDDSEAEETELAADLVVDASGRNSQAPQWLESLGYAPPDESTVDALPGYATRIYRRPSQFNASWKMMHIKPAAPDSTRGGLIVPIEGDRWHVTLIGMGGDYPPTDEEGFLEFARSLPSPQLYEAIKDAEPLTKPYGYRGATNRARRYDELPRYLEGLLVVGDAVYTLNPVYGQGMTAAALGSLALDDCLGELRRQGAVGDVTGLARSFQKQLSQAVAGPWRMATREDRRWPVTQVSEGTSPVQHRAPGLKVNRPHRQPLPLAQPQALPLAA